MVWEIIEGFRKAVELIVSGDPTVIGITFRSLYISGTATLLSILWSLPTAILVGLRDFTGKRFVKGTFNALMGVPTVALGLVLYLLFSRSGPLGPIHLLYNPLGIMIGQAVLVTPMMVSLTTSAIESISPEIKELAKTLGASETQASMTVLEEATGGVLLAVVAGFDRAIAELGVAMMLGANMPGITRVLTTTIAMETGRGNIELGIALSVILLLIVFAVSLVTNLIQRRKT